MMASTETEQDSFAESQLPRGVGGVGALWASARAPPADEESARFDGQTVLIVGATAGVGHEAAIKIASRGVARLIIGARDMSRAESAKQAIVAQSGLAASAIDLFHVDFASFTSVQTFANDLEARVPVINVALISAGIGFPEYRTSETGWEAMLQTNALSTSLCAILLLPLLRKSGAALGHPALLEIVGSEAYLDVQESWLPADYAAETILDHYNQKINFTLDRQYHIAKLLIMFVQQSLVALGKSNPLSPTIVVASPGMCRTSMGRDFPLSMRAFMSVFQFFVARSAEQGSRALVSGARLGAEASGRFWTNDQLDPRVPLLSQASWEKARETEFKRIIEVLDEACLGLRGILTL